MLTSLYYHPSGDRFNSQFFLDDSKINYWLNSPQIQRYYYSLSCSSTETVTKMHEVREVQNLELRNHLYTRFFRCFSPTKDYIVLSEKY